MTVPTGVSRTLDAHGYGIVLLIPLGGCTSGRMTAAVKDSSDARASTLGA